MERHMHYRTMEVQPISGALGAEIHGVDLAKGLSNEQFAEMCHAHYDYGVIFLVLWYFPERKIAVISTSYADLSVSQNVEKSVTQCARPLRFPWTSPM